MAMEIRLTSGEAVLIDESVYDRLSRFKWVLRGGYACRCRKKSESGHGKIILMHREIMSAPPRMEVDHINGNKLDNRTSNLRVCTHSQNTKNRGKNQRAGYSQYKGVSFEKTTGKWTAQIRVAGRLKKLGRFIAEQDAADAYNKAALLNFDKFARINTINRG